MSTGNLFTPVPRSIAVVRALQLGDMLCAVPALRALRAACPGSRITLIGLPWARDFVRRFSAYLDDFIEFPGYPGLPERACDLGRFPEFLREAQARRFDVALQMHGSGRHMNSITALLAARCSAGYNAAQEYWCEPPTFLPWREHEHEIVRWLRLVEEMGAPSRGLELEFPLDAPDLQEAHRVAARARLASRRYVCLHPGSQLPSRRWAPQRFAEVGDALAAKGYAVAITGTASEEPLAERVANAMRFRAVSLAGRTSLGCAAALIRGARLLVCNDTGVSHIAAAMQTPSVVVSCGSDPQRWAPRHHQRHRVLYHPIECRPCSHAVCPIGHPCAEAVEAEVVIAVAQQLLADEGATAKDSLQCVH